MGRGQCAGMHAWPAGKDGQVQFAQRPSPVFFSLKKYNFSFAEIHKLATLLSERAYAELSSLDPSDVYATHPPRLI
jgi:hypothetical protein